MWKFLQIEIFATNLCCTFILNMFQSQAERWKVVEEELVEVKQDLTRLKEQLKLRRNVEGAALLETIKKFYDGEIL